MIAVTESVLKIKWRAKATWMKGALGSSESIDLKNLNPLKFV